MGTNHTDERMLEAVLAEYRRDPRRALTEAEVVCLECGRSFRHLTNTHLNTHGLTSETYKQRFGYNMRRALMIGPVRRRHADNASRSGLAARIRRRPILEDVELRRRGGRHPHTLEELLTRAERGSRLPRPWPARDDRGRFTTALRMPRIDGPGPARVTAYVEAAGGVDVRLLVPEDMC